MKNVAELDIAQSIVTFSALWSRLQELGASEVIATKLGSIAVNFADDGGVDRAYEALVALGFAGHTVFVPRTVTHDGKRWRDATVCMGNGKHLMLTGPMRPVLEAV